MYMSQQDDKDYLTKSEMQRLETPPKKHMILNSTAGAVAQSASASKLSVKAKEGRTLASCSDPSLSVPLQVVALELKVC